MNRHLAQLYQTQAGIGAPDITDESEICHGREMPQDGRGGKFGGLQLYIYLKTNSDNIIE